MGQPNDDINMGALLEEMEVATEETPQISIKVPFATTPQMASAEVDKANEVNVSSND